MGENVIVSWNFVERMDDLDGVFNLHTALRIRIQIRDPDAEPAMEKKPRSGIQDEHPGSYL